MKRILIIPLATLLLVTPTAGGHVPIGTITISGIPATTVFSSPGGFASYTALTNVGCTVFIRRNRRVDLTMSFTHFTPSIPGVVGQAGFQYSCTGTSRNNRGEVTYCKPRGGPLAGWSYTYLRIRSDNFYRLHVLCDGGVSWLFPNRPSFKTGTYTSLVTFTISST